MKSAHLLTIAFGMIACTHLQRNNTVCAGDSTPLQQVDFSANNFNQPVVVSPKQSVVNSAPELPLFKDVLSYKGLFW